jgi:hypothetical protein
MRRLARVLVLCAGVVGALALPATGAADHATRPHTPNMHALGHSPQTGTFEVPDGQRTINSDIAFWGNLAFDGNYDGFRIIDISDPENPVELSHPGCNGDQGDIVVWQNILVRSWNSKKTVARDCDGTTVPAGREGVHIFDISDKTDPAVVKFLELPCGSHTLTVAGVSNGSLIVYSNNSSSAGCVDGTRANDDPVGDFMDVIDIPLDHPENASLLRREPLAGPQADVRTGCHDAAVIRGDINMAACASADTVNVWDIGANDTPGGSLEDPELLRTITEPGVGDLTQGSGRWHSAAFTWDGEVLVLGWEPGGGSEPRCTETGTIVPDPPGPDVTQTDTHKSMFFFDADTGDKLGTWVLPRPQGLDENCTIHNYNVVPLRSGRYVAVSGNYQAGTWVTDFTDPADATTVGWSDPPSLGPGSFCDGMCQLGGAWSSYWYNNFIYESEITKGLNVFRLSDRRTDGTIRLARLNPQTEEFSLP